MLDLPDHGRGSGQGFLFDALVTRPECLIFRLLLKKCKPSIGLTSGPANLDRPDDHLLPENYTQAVEKLQWCRAGWTPYLRCRIEHPSSASGPV